jgi:hypothetical protein
VGRRLTRAALAALGGGTVALSPGCNQSVGSGFIEPAPVDASLMDVSIAAPYGIAPLIDADDDVSGCLAAGGQCSDTPCEFGIAASCGVEGAGFCCVPCQADPDVHRILASNYTQTCTVDSDCVAVGVGDPCQVCNILCATNAAINRSSLLQYMSDVAKSPPIGDAASCACQTTALSVCCNSGTCDPSCGVDGSAGSVPPVDAAVEDAVSDATSDAGGSYGAEDTGPNDQEGGAD